MSQNTIDWSVIARLRRELKNWSQARLSREAGLAKATICLIEQQGRESPYADTAYKLAHALGVTLDEFYAAAGYVPTAWPVPETPDELYLLRLFRVLDGDGQAMALEMLGALSRIRQPAE